VAGRLRGFAAIIPNRLEEDLLTNLFGGAAADDVGRDPTIGAVEPGLEKELVSGNDGTGERPPSLDDGLALLEDIVYDNRLIHEYLDELPGREPAGRGRAGGGSGSFEESSAAVAAGASNSVRSLSDRTCVAASSLEIVNRLTFPEAVRPS
jgi:hypothetical protein